MIEAVAVAVADETQPGEARRVASGMARLLGFDETSAGRVALVVTEVATNIVKHGGGGEILIRPLQEEDERQIRQKADLAGISGRPILPDGSRVRDQNVFEEKRAHRNDAGEGMQPAKDERYPLTCTQRSHAVR